MGNVEVAWEDVISVIQLVRNHIIVMIAALICMIVVMVFARRWEKTFYQSAVIDCIFSSDGIDSKYYVIRCIVQHDKCCSCR